MQVVLSKDCHFIVERNAPTKISKTGSCFAIVLSFKAHRNLQDTAWILFYGTQQLQKQESAHQTYSCTDAVTVQDICPKSHAHNQWIPRIQEVP